MRRVQLIASANAAAMLIFAGCASRPSKSPDFAEPAERSPRAYAFRLGPGRDLMQGLKSFAALHHLKAASIVSAVAAKPIALRK